MLTRIGLKVSVDAMTQSQFFAKRNRREFGFWLAGWLADTGEMSSPLKSLIATPEQGQGHGPHQSGRLFEPQGRRAASTRRSPPSTTTSAPRCSPRRAAPPWRITALLPLHFEMTTWAMRKNLDYMPRADQYTQATLVRPVK